MHDPTSVTLGAAPPASVLPASVPPESTTPSVSASTWLASTPESLAPGFGVLPSTAPRTSDIEPPQDHSSEHDAPNTATSVICTSTSEAGR
jgi:hypothetical protein